MVTDIGKDWTWSKVFSCSVLSYKNYYLHLPSLNPGHHAIHRSLPLPYTSPNTVTLPSTSPQALCLKLLLLSLSLPLPLKIILQGRHQTKKVSAQAFVAFPGHSVLLLNIGAASFLAKGNFSGQKEGNLQQFPLLNFLWWSLFLRFSWPDPKSKFCSQEICLHNWILTMWAYDCWFWAGYYQHGQKKLGRCFSLIFSFVMWCAPIRTRCREGLLTWLVFTCVSKLLMLSLWQFSLDCMPLFQCKCIHFCHWKCMPHCTKLFHSY